MSQALAKKLVPLMDRVLVERVVAATKTSGGILLPETVGSKVRDSSSSSSSSSSSLRLPIFQSSNRRRRRRRPWR